MQRTFLFRPDCRWWPGRAGARAEPGLAATRLAGIVRAALLLTLAGALPPAAAESPAQMCDRAAWLAAAELDLPASVLRSVTRAETGRARGGGLEPWPWTVNMEGEGHWFETEGAARAFVEAAFRRGARSFDIGCFQINYRWHGTAFRSIEQMFDPMANARYAARFLADLYAETGDWSRAAGAYHSRSPQFAERYRARFDRIRQTLGDGTDSVTRLAAAATPAPRPMTANNFPLLQAVNGERSNGSLVPLAVASRGALIELGPPASGS